MEAPVTADARKMGTVNGGGAPALLAAQPPPTARLMRLSTIAAPSAAAFATAGQSICISRFNVADEWMTLQLGVRLIR
jgi:hypothetical protein